MKNIIFTMTLSLLFCTFGMAGEVKDPYPTDLIQSTVSPYYFCYQKDFDAVVKNNPSQQVSTLLAIATHGRIDIDRMAEKITSLKEDLALHPKISALFYKDLLPRFKSNNYIGTELGTNNEVAAGWFGGISIYTVGVLDSLMKIQDTLPKAKKMRFLGIGSGNAFFEYLLSQIGETTAMDVVQTETVADKVSLDGNDSRNLLAITMEDGFFMNVNIHQSQSPGELDQIVDETFSGKDYQNTILVLSWPREFALKYIHKFIKKGGKSIIFIRNHVVGSIFDKSHLGEISGANSEFKAYLRQKHKISIKLNTSTHSTLDLYSITKDSPVELALKNMAARFSLDQE